jgi:phage tail tape-measure protein
MKAEKKLREQKAEKETEKPWLKSHAVGAPEAGAIAGEIAGAVIGSVAGPVGAIAGMVIGAVAGAVAGEELAVESDRVSKHDKELDEEIGVTKGDLGAVQPGGPPRSSGHVSLASLGLSGGGGTSAEGPIQDVDD